jgi:acyl-coenzyme A thioesterase PaaI-like protein
MTAAELQELFTRLFPSEDGRRFLIEDVAPMSARVRLRFHERNVRPGGTLCGPALVTLADAALYVAVMGMLGPVTLAVGEVSITSDDDELVAHATGTYSIPPQ